MIQEILYIGSKKPKIVDPEVLIYKDIRIKIAKDALSGLIDLKLETPKLVLIDLDISKINGFDCLRMIRSTPKYHHVKVGVVSKDKNYTQIKNAFALGADYFLVEPLLSRTLIFIINDINYQANYQSFENVINQYNFAENALQNQKNLV